MIKLLALVFCLNIAYAGDLAPIERKKASRPLSGNFSVQYYQDFHFYPSFRISYNYQDSKVKAFLKKGRTGKTEDDAVWLFDKKGNLKKKLFRKYRKFLSSTHHPGRSIDNGLYVNGNWSMLPHEVDQLEDIQKKSEELNLTLADPGVPRIVTLVEGFPFRGRPPRNPKRYCTHYPDRTMLCEKNLGIKGSGWFDRTIYLNGNFTLLDDDEEFIRYNAKVRYPNDKPLNVSLLLKHVSKVPHKLEKQTRVREETVKCSAFDYACQNKRSDCAVDQEVRRRKTIIRYDIFDSQTYWYKVVGVQVNDAKKRPVLYAWQNLNKKEDRMLKSFVVRGDLIDSSERYRLSDPFCW